MVVALANPLADRLERLDALHARRDDPAAVSEARRLADETVALAPADYQVLWRASRAVLDESEQGGRAALGKIAYDLAERAIAVEPDRVEGHYWAALGIGRYGEGMGVLRALASGIEGKFKRPLERATALDVRYDHGNIPTVWAAYHLELPWPKRDRPRAAEECRQALGINPANLRARLYLARIAVAQGRPAEARRWLEEIAAAPVGRYDAPEERRVKREAAALRVPAK
jgi:hypothetical protein